MKLIFFLLTITTYSHTLQACMPSSMDLDNPNYQPQTMLEGLIRRELTEKNILKKMQEHLLYPHSKPQECISLGKIKSSPKYYFSKDNKFFACIHGKRDRNILLVNIENKKLTKISLDSEITTLLISNNSATMFIATINGYIYTYSLQENRIKYKTQAYRPYQNPAYILNTAHILLALSSDDQHLIVCGQPAYMPYDTVLTIIRYSVSNDILSTSKSTGFHRTKWYVKKCLLYEPTNEIILIKNDESIPYFSGLYFFSNILQYQELGYRHEVINGIKDILLLPDHKTILIAANNTTQETSSIYIYNHQTNDLTEWSSSIPAYIDELTLSPSGNMLIASCFSQGQKKALFWDIESKKIVLSIPLSAKVQYFTPQNNQPGHFFAIRSELPAIRDELPECYLELWSP